MGLRPAGQSGSDGLTILTWRKRDRRVTGIFHLRHYPVFEEGVFEDHPALFDRFAHYTSENLRERFRDAWKTLPRYEHTLTWSVVVGPGFCGGTHPGADNVFIEAMLGSNDFVYDSDCLYANPSRKVFAISDPPGITDASRRLFGRLDQHLHKRGIDDLEAILNELNRETAPSDGATLSLIAFPAPPSITGPRRAVAFIAGDSYVFRGNLSHQRMTAVEGIPEFIGTPHTYLEPVTIDLDEGDFFIIASDGILSIRGNDRERALVDILRERVDGNLQDFAFRAIRDSNQCLEETIYDRPMTRFGGSDNVSALLVCPEELADVTSQESFLIGGYKARHPA